MIADVRGRQIPVCRGYSPLSCFIVPDNDFPIENDPRDPETDRFLKPQCSLAPPMQRGRSGEACSCFTGMCHLHQRRISSAPIHHNCQWDSPKCPNPRWPAASASVEMEFSLLAQSDGSHLRRVTRNQSD
ncbi:hypothetical protein JOQ06_008310 [Pogonophryne albipinna]|uniref:Uncharacterized protein n=1 Tax=Pogonophryne albipinna TaxID=1090488 RepID=A0AAD6F9X5_9TELE|nr:hypothetical protein JOQ06_008310 [Pogonophryne albipinna]